MTISLNEEEQITANINDAITALKIGFNKSENHELSTLPDAQIRMDHLEVVISPNEGELHENYVLRCTEIDRALRSGTGHFVFRSGDWRFERV